MYLKFIPQIAADRGQNGQNSRPAASLRVTSACRTWPSATGFKGKGQSLPERIDLLLHAPDVVGLVEARRTKTRMNGSLRARPAYSWGLSSACDPAHLSPAHGELNQKEVRAHQRPSKAAPIAKSQTPDRAQSFARRALRVDGPRRSRRGLLQTSKRKLPCVTLLPISSARLL